MQSILLIDWPTRELPEALARGGFEVVAEEGPSTYVAYEADGDGVRRGDADEPEGVDLVYAYRPLDELPEIVRRATRLGARTLWWETGPQPQGSDELARARAIVERAGLEFRAGRPPVSAV